MLIVEKLIYYLFSSLLFAVLHNLVKRFPRLSLASVVLRRPVILIKSSSLVVEFLYSSLPLFCRTHSSGTLFLFLFSQLPTVILFWKLESTRFLIRTALCNLRWGFGVYSFYLQFTLYKNPLLVPLLWKHVTSFLVELFSRL